MNTNFQRNHSVIFCAVIGLNLIFIFFLAGNQIISKPESFILFLLNPFSWTLQKLIDDLCIVTWFHLLNNSVR